MTTDPLSILVKSPAEIAYLRAKGSFLTLPLKAQHFRVLHAGQVLRKKFQSWAEASFWADWNFKSRGNKERRALWDIKLMED